jgi:hypothetical protein
MMMLAVLIYAFAWPLLALNLIFKGIKNGRGQ